MTLPIPANLAAANERDNAPGRRAWVAELPIIVATLAARWSLRVGHPFEPGGQCSWVAPARDQRGRDLVLKVGWTHEEARDEAAGLRSWRGDGAVRLHDAFAEGSFSALLLERCTPGTVLSHALAEPNQDVVVARVLARLWQAPTEGPFRSLESMCAMWVDGFDARVTAAEGYDLDPGLIRTGRQLFLELPASADRAVLLATDLHAGNILAARRHPWLAIDPKPYVGDPCYDPLQHLVNRQLGPDPARAVDRVAELLSLDPQRLRLWLFARCVVGSLDMPHLREVARQLRP